MEEKSVVYAKRNIYKKLLLRLMIGCLLFIILIGYGVYWAFYDMNRLQTGEYLTEATSPDGKYTIKAFVTNGDATTSNGIRGELVFNEQGYKTKNIYWNYREDTADINWIDNNKMIINGYTLKVPNEKFDYRHQ
ncbi:hypothetical protein EW028_00580 [Lysinibacillus sp. OL1]|nr:hypothetical protein EW028_00580 [Lysinibacillus sp. OL1]